MYRILWNHSSLWGPMFDGKQIFAGLWGRYFVDKQKMSVRKITLTCVLGLFTKNERVILEKYLLLDANYKKNLSCIQ